MSRNFELLTQFEKSRVLFGETADTSEPVVINPIKTKSENSAPNVLLKPAELGLAEPIRREMEKLVHRVFQTCQDDSVPHAVMFCGIETGDGTSWISAQVARMTAAQGLGTVCVVDTNFSSPNMHTYFDLSNERGLANALQDGQPILNFLQNGNIPNLYVLSAGTGADACLTLMAERIRDRIGELRAHCDWLIFDVPPLGYSGEAVVLGQMVDGVVIVVSANSTRRATARTAKENLQAAQVRLLGAVLNNRTFPIPEPLYRRL